jgi:hypothetical protein
MLSSFIAHALPKVVPPSGTLTGSATQPALSHSLGPTTLSMVAEPKPVRTVPSWAWAVGSNELSKQRTPRESVMRDVARRDARPAWAIAIPLSRARPLLCWLRQAVSAAWVVASMGGVYHRRVTDSSQRGGLSRDRGRPPFTSPPHLLWLNALLVSRELVQRARPRRWSERSSASQRRRIPL